MNVCVIPLIGEVWSSFRSWGKGSTWEGGGFSGVARRPAAPGGGGGAVIVEGFRLHVYNSVVNAEPCNAGIIV